MVKVVEVVNGLATVYERNELAAGTLESILPFVENRVPVVLPVLPRNNVVSAVYDESDPTAKRLELLISVDPRIMTLDYNDPIEIEPRVSLPYTLYFIEMRTAAETPQGQDWSMDQFRVFWSKTQVKSLDQDVIPAILPNIYEDGNVCFGDTGVPARQPLADRVDQTVNEFMHTTFTAHEVRGEREWPWNGRSYRRWVRATEAHGNIGYQRIPEFDPTNGYCAHFKLEDLFREHPRKDQYVLPDGIPGLNFTPTFGRAEEWIRGLNGTQIFRLERAIQLLRDEDPNFIQAPAPVTDDDEEDDD